MIIFSGNIDTGFVLGDFSAAADMLGGWNVYGPGSDERIAWFASVVEALRYLAARDNALRLTRISQELVRWGITERKAQRNG